MRRDIWAGSFVVALVVAIAGIPSKAQNSMCSSSYCYGCCVTWVIPPSGTRLSDGRPGINYLEVISAEPHTNCNSNMYVTWAIVSGALPPGLHSYTPITTPWELHILGVPTVPGTYDFVARVTPECGTVIDASYQIVVLPAGTLALDPPRIPPARRFNPYEVQFTASGGTPPYTFRLAGSLPPGLRLWPWGHLAGVPGEMGVYQFDVQVYDGAGGYGTGSYTLPVSCSLYDVEPDELSDAVVNVAYQQQLTARNGAPPYVFSLGPNGAPPGIDLSSTGLVSGTPQAIGRFAIDVEVVDYDGCRMSKSYQLGIWDGVSFLAGRGAGQPNDNRVKVLKRSGGSTPVDFLAYQAGAWGTYVSAADVTGILTETILAGPGPGATLGPQVRGFDRYGQTLTGINYYAYGTLRYGVHAEGAAVDGDEFTEIVTTPGAGEPFGPHVRAFNYDASQVRTIPGINYYAYNTLKYGAEVAGGDLEGDGIDELVTGPGPGPAFGPTVRGWRFYGGALSGYGPAFDAFGTPGYGAVVATGEVDGDDVDETLVAVGPGPTATYLAHVRGFEHGATSIAALPGFEVHPFVYPHGARVDAGDIGLSGLEDLVVGAGPDPAAPSRIRVYAYTGTTLTSRAIFATPFGGTYGVDSATGHLGW